MARGWKAMAARLRANQQRNLQDYAGQSEKNERRKKALVELQNSQSAALKAERGRR